MSKAAFLGQADSRYWRPYRSNQAPKTPVFRAFYAPEAVSQRFWRFGQANAPASRPDPEEHENGKKSVQNANEFSHSGLTPDLFWTAVKDNT